MELIIVLLIILIMKRKDILILGKGWTDGLDETQITAEAEYSINISEWTEKFYLGLHCNESNF